MDQQDLFSSNNAVKTKKTHNHDKTIIEIEKIDLKATGEASKGIAREVRDGCVILHFTGKR